MGEVTCVSETEGGEMEGEGPELRRSGRECQVGWEPLAGEEGRWRKDRFEKLGLVW